MHLCFEGLLANSESSRGAENVPGTCTPAEPIRAEKAQLPTESVAEKATRRRRLSDGDEMISLFLERDGFKSNKYDK